MKNVLKNRNFMLLWLAQVIEQSADSLVVLSLIAWAISLKTGGSASGNVSLLMLWIAIPILLIGPVAGVLTDRAKKQAVITASAIVRGICILVIGLIIGSKSNGAYVFLMVFLISAVAQFFGAAKASMIPLLVRRDDLIQANSFAATAVITFQIFTYAAGGALISASGHRNVIFAGAAMYAVVAVLAAFINANEKRGSNDDGRIHSIWREFGEGLAQLIGSKGTFAMVVRVSALLVCAGLVYVSLTGSFLAVIINESRIALPPIKALGFMQAFLGFGLVAGMMIITNAVKFIKEEDLAGFLLPVMGLCAAALYFVRDYYFLLFIAIAAGISGVIIISLAETAIQKNTPERMRGRVFSVYYILRTAGLALASSLTGVLAGVISEDKIVLASGAALFIYGLAGFAARFIKRKRA